MSFATLRAQITRLRWRLLAVNLLVLLVPPAGLEFARLYERQLLDALERDMRNQATVVKSFVEGGAAPERAEPMLTEAARSTRTRIRLLDPAGKVVADSHASGPPEGPEAVPQRGPIRQATRDIVSDVSPAVGPKWADLPDRAEVKRALAGELATMTRVRGKEPAVLLFLAMPVTTQAGRGVVYVTRSTQPAVIELRRIRAGLYKLLAIAAVATGIVTLLLAWSISRPLSKLARAARRVAIGERGVAVPIVGSGEVRELSESVAAMQTELAARAQKVGDFAADVAHEFKSPLTSLRGAAELLREGAANDPEARERFLGNIELDVERLDRLVTRLLELSRIEAGSEPLASVDLAQLARRVAARCSTPETEVLVEVTAEKTKVRARATDLETALANLVDNAVRVSDGTPVHVRIRDATTGGRDAVSVEVEDDGPGVPPEIGEKVWERFFTTDAERSGTGLGLAIVRSVATGAGGRAEMESPRENGRGATFRLILPR